MTTRDLGSSDGGGAPRDYDGQHGDFKLISQRLEQFAQKWGIQSLQDRLRIGLNEVGALAMPEVDDKIKNICKKLCPDSRVGAARAYGGTIGMAIDIQQGGVWSYAQDLSKAESPEAKAWLLLRWAAIHSYEREMTLSPEDFLKNTDQLIQNLGQAETDPGEFFPKAQREIMERSKGAIRFNKADKQKEVPIGEGLNSFLSMALNGYEAGVAQDADGFVFVGARGEIKDDLVCSCGLKAEVGPDDKDPRRTVTWYVNNEGHRVVKKIHPGFLVVVSRSLDLAGSIVRAINGRKEMIEVAEEALGHTRVIQTSEAERAALGISAEDYKAFLKKTPTKQGPSNIENTGTAVLSQRTEFYNAMLHIRDLYVYLDALEREETKRRKQGRELTEEDKIALGKEVYQKMSEKVAELEYVNEIIKDAIDDLPEKIDEIVDMAGGAGDLGLAIANEMMASGRRLKRVEIVDPQEGTDEFMDCIIGYLPFRDKLKEVAIHNNGYLQTATINPESVVVAKHACGTLTDDVIDQWVNSESPLLVAMTCCQGKAQNQTARYGLKQAEWKCLCQESDWTNVRLRDDDPENKQRVDKERLAKGKDSMKKLDMARVEYLRRLGFEAELKTTDKFPKGDVIVARRLPKDFMDQLMRLNTLKTADGASFDLELKKIDRLSRGLRGVKKEMQFGGAWSRNDYRELSRRLKDKPKEVGVESPVAEVSRPEDAGPAKKGSEMFRRVFSDNDGRVDQYVMQRAISQIGKSLPPTEKNRLIGLIRKEVGSRDGQDVAVIRQAVDDLMKASGL